MTDLQDRYVNWLDVVLAVAAVGFAIWALAATDSRPQTVGFGITGLVLGLVSATVLRGRFAMSGMAMLIIGLLYGVSTADALPGAAYGLLFTAAFLGVPQGFRNAKNGRVRRREGDA